MAKQEDFSDRIRQIAEHIRSFPETQKTVVFFENDQGEPIGEPQQIHDSPSELRLENAGNSLRRVLRLGCFKDDAERMIQEWRPGGGKALWRELVTNLRVRANLPYPRDYLRTFAEDCGLVADALHREAAASSGGGGSRDNVPYSPRQLAKREGVPLDALRKRLERLRRHDFDSFIENEDRKGNEPQFLYYWNSVRPIIEQMKEVCKTSRSRPG